MDDSGSSSIRNALDNHGEMSRFRSQNGIRISPSPSASSYIVCSRITRILRDYTAAKPSVSNRKIDRMITKINKLSKTDLEYLYYLGTEESVQDMVCEIAKTYGHISSQAQRWKWGDGAENL